MGTGALNALDVFFVTENLHADASLYGLLGMGEGIGAIVGTLAAARLCRRLGDVRVLYWGLTAIGLGLLIYGRLTALPVAVAVLALLGLPLGGINVAMTPIILREVPREMLGRAVSVFGPLQQLANMVSVFAAGWLVSTVLLHLDVTIGGIRFGRIDSVFLVCGLLIAAGGLYTWIALRGAEASASTVVEEAPAGITGS